MIELKSVENPPEKPKAPEEEIEAAPAAKDVPKPLRDIPEVKSRWERFRDKTKEKLAAVYEKTGLADTVDRAKVVVNRAMMKFHVNDAVVYTKKLGERNQNIEFLQKKFDDYDSSIKKMKELGVHGDKEVSADLGKERMKLAEKIDKEKKKADRIQSKLEVKNLKKERYEGRVGDICEKAKNRIDRHLNPFEQKLGELKLERESLKSEIVSFKDTRGRFTEEIKTLEAAAKGAVWKTEKMAYEAKIKEIKKTIGKADAMVEKKMKERTKIEKGIAANEKNANPWRDKRNEFARFTKIESPDTSVPKKKTEEFGARSGGTEKSGPEGSAAEKFGEKAEKFETPKLIALWNKHFGSELSLTPQILEKLGGFSAKRMSADYFLNLAGLYDANIHGAKGPQRREFDDKASMFRKIVDRHAGEM